MGILAITQIILLVGLVICILGIALRLREIMNRPYKADLARPQGSVRSGILFAFTLGMAPWEKESTRIHWIAYLRGIFFHVGIFTAFGVLLISLLRITLPTWILWLAAAITGVGAIFGFAGIVMRLRGENERVLSLPDDYVSVFLVSLFTALGCIAALWPTILPVSLSCILPIFYIVSAVMLVYIPVSKIRHCVYFFYSKFFFGMSFGQSRCDRPIEKQIC